MTSRARSPLAPCRGVLFDLDGVLIDSARAWYQVVGRAAAFFGSPPVRWEAFLRTFGQGPEADQQAFFPGIAVAEVVRFFDEGFPKALHEVAVAKGAQTVLERLGQAGLLRGVVTNTPLDLARQVLTVKGLDRHVDALAAAGEAAEKPAPDLIHLVLKRLNLAPANVVYVGDSPSDEAAARAAGVYLVGFGRPGDVRIDALTELLAVCGVDK